MILPDDATPKPDAIFGKDRSLDHPVEIKAGMTFALETQHGKRFRYGVRIEEMLIVHEKEIEIISNFPVKQITVVDPIPGYGDHVK
jgi:Xaa-Pro aminopeptidase